MLYSNSRLFAKNKTKQNNVVVLFFSITYNLVHYLLGIDENGNQKLNYIYNYKRIIIIIDNNITVLENMQVEFSPNL